MQGQSLRQAGQSRPHRCARDRPQPPQLPTSFPRARADECLKRHQGCGGAYRRHPGDPANACRERGRWTRACGPVGPGEAEAAPGNPKDGRCGGSPTCPGPSPGAAGARGPQAYQGLCGGIASAVSDASFFVCGESPGWAKRLIHLSSTFPQFSPIPTGSGLPWLLNPFSHVNHPNGDTVKSNTRPASREECHTGAPGQGRSALSLGHPPAKCPLAASRILLTTPLALLWEHPPLCNKMTSRPDSCGGGGDTQGHSAALEGPAAGFPL